MYSTIRVIAPGHSNVHVWVCIYNQEIKEEQSGECLQYMALNIQLWNTFVSTHTSIIYNSWHIEQ